LAGTAETLQANKREKPVCKFPPDGIIAGNGQWHSIH